MTAIANGTIHSLKTSKVVSKGFADSVDTTLIDVIPATFKPTSRPTTILVTKVEMNFMEIMMTVMLLKK